MLRGTLQSFGFCFLTLAVFLGVIDSAQSLGQNHFIYTPLSTIISFLDTSFPRLNLANHLSISVEWDKVVDALFALPSWALLFCFALLCYGAAYRPRPKFYQVLQ